MKNAHLTNEGKAGASGTGAAIIGQSSRVAVRALIPANAREGLERDALRCSCGAYYLRVRRTKADKRNAVMTLLGDAEWSKLSNRAIAGRCNVSHTYVSNLRKTAPIVMGAPA